MDCTDSALAEGPHSWPARAFFAHPSLRGLPVLFAGRPMDGLRIERVGYLRNLRAEVSRRRDEGARLEVWRCSSLLVSQRTRAVVPDRCTQGDGRELQGYWCIVRCDRAPALVAA